MANPRGVEIYTWESCPYSQRAKRILEGAPEEEGLEPGEFIEFQELMIEGDPRAREEMVRRCEGNRTVPQILVDGERVGGCFDLVAAVQNRTFRDIFAPYIRRK